MYRHLKYRPTNCKNCREIIKKGSGINTKFKNKTSDEKEGNKQSSKYKKNDTHLISFSRQQKVKIIRKVKQSRNKINYILLFFSQFIYFFFRSTSSSVSSVQSAFVSLCFLFSSLVFRFLFRSYYFTIDYTFFVIFVSNKTKITYISEVTKRFRYLFCRQ